jgi:hypothetical protein
MTLEFKQAVKALDEQIEVLKQDLFFALVSTKHKPQRMAHKIFAVRREWDNPAEERMKLSRIYCFYTNMIQNSTFAKSKEEDYYSVV